MKFTVGIFNVVGWLTLVGGIAGTAWGFLRPGDEIAQALIFMWIPLAIMGGVFVWAGGFMSGLTGGADIPNGVLGTAQIMSVQDSGVTINETNLVVNVDLLVSIPGAPAYTAAARVMLQGRTMWGALRPGMTVPVKVDPKDPSKVAVVLDGPVNAADASPQILAQAANAVLGAGGAAAGQQAGMITMKAADIIRDGVKTTGKLVSVTPTGLTASQASVGLAPDEADDPLVVVEFTFAGDGGVEHSNKGLARVPDGKAGFLAAGAAIPVAYLAGRPETATIDWSRLV